MRKVKFEEKTNVCIFLYNSLQPLGLNDVIGGVKNSLHILYNVYTHVRQLSVCMCVWFSHIQFTLGNILPATGFLPDQAHKVLVGSEGCSSQGIPQEGFPHPQKWSQ